MRLWRVQLALLLALVASAVQSSRATDRLIRDAGPLGEPDGYTRKLRHVFADAFAKGVPLRVVVIPSFRQEYAVGIRENGTEVEAFVFEASSPVWDTELIRMYESGELRAFKDGKEVPLAKSESYQRLKKKTPNDYRAIKLDRQTRPLPKDLARFIKTHWNEMLSAANNAEEEGGGEDDDVYHFSATVEGRGVLYGHIGASQTESRTARFVDLAEALAEYTRGKATLEKLSRQLEVAKGR